ncbi:hypothetical protein CALVIDRAFT_476434, partial [Calocera viscosa TUFC12733]
LWDPRRSLAALYTLGRGAMPVVITSLRCTACGSTFHINYFCQADDDGTQWRVYYDGLPSIVRVRHHALFEDKLCQLFRALTVHSHSSMTATSRVYNSTLSAETSSGWQAPHLQPKDIANAFDLYSLLLHHHEQQTRLRLPDSAPTEVDRLATAMQDRNHFMAGTGQEQWAHACELCRKYFLHNGQEYTLSCAITDGVSIGRPCCAIHNCPNPLPSNRAHYCHVHTTLESICAVEGCDRLVQGGKRTCDLDQHIRLESNYRAIGQSFNLLKTRLQLEGVEVEAVEVEAAEVEAAEVEAAEVEAHGMQKKAAKIKARFARRRTHNEQLVVRPCGIILARGTFYGAEALGSVADFLKTVFPARCSLPDVLFYDNNCNFHRYIADRPRLQEHFQDTALVVDIFHFKSKHSENDLYCNRHCNALAYPELFDEEKKTWTFNSSACEQTNAWLNNFQPIVREMLPVRYEFFLDEVIKERNRHLVNELQKRGHMPHLLPASELMD